MESSSKSLVVGSVNYSFVAPLSIFTPVVIVVATGILRLDVETFEKMIVIH